MSDFGLVLKAWLGVLAEFLDVFTRSREILPASSLHRASTDALIIYIYIYIQWNLRITDKLVHRLMSAIRRLSFIGGFLPKILYFTFLSTVHPLFYIFMTY